MCCISSFCSAQFCNTARSLPPSGVHAVYLVVCTLYHTFFFCLSQDETRSVARQAGNHLDSCAALSPKPVQLLLQHRTVACHVHPPTFVSWLRGPAAASTVVLSLVPEFHRAYLPTTEYYWKSLSYLIMALYTINTAV